MKKLFCILTLCWSTGAAGQPATTPGKFWNELTPSLKTAYIRGFTEGATLATTAIAALASEPETQATYFATPRAGALPFDSALYRATREMTPSAAKFTALRQLMDETYLDPANTCIDWPAAFLLAVKKLDGAHPDMLAAIVRQVRAKSTVDCGR